MKFLDKENYRKHLLFYLVESRFGVSQGTTGPFAAGQLQDPSDLHCSV